MSKYIKLEDAISKIVNTPTRVITDDLTALADRQHEIIDMLSDLQTIEVSEDAISREWAINKQKELIELYTPHKAVEGRGQVYWQIEERELVAKELEQAPSVVPQPKEGEWAADTPQTDEIGDCNICRFAGCSECDDCINGSEWVRMVDYLEDVDDE